MINTIDVTNICWIIPIILCCICKDSKYSKIDKLSMWNIRCHVNIPLTESLQQGAVCYFNWNSIWKMWLEEGRTSVSDCDAHCRNRACVTSWTKWFIKQWQQTHVFIDQNSVDVNLSPTPFYAFALLLLLLFGLTCSAYVPSKMSKYKISKMKNNERLMCVA